MALGYGFLQMAQHMKENGLEQKKMVKESKFGPMEYEGEWANGFMNGKGTFTWSDGKQKAGIWKNGKLQE